MERTLSVTTAEGSGTKTLVDKLMTGGIGGLTSVGSGECSGGRDMRFSSVQGVTWGMWERIVIVGVVCILLVLWGALKVLCYFVFCIRRHGLLGNHKILRWRKYY